MSLKSGSLILLALGGNAICQSNQKGTRDEHFENIGHACEELVKLDARGYRLILTHGNGPQVGAMLIQQETSASEIPPQPLDVCGAMSQGMIGYMFQNTLRDKLAMQGRHHAVVSLVSQVIVRADDPDFQNPSKPVGPFYTREESLCLEKSRAYRMKEVKPGTPKGFRRVVASPEPQGILEETAIRTLLQSGAIVIAGGGGGIPVIEREGRYHGCEAVIDKDKGANILAQKMGADLLIIATDVKNACIHFGTPQQRSLEGKISLREMEKFEREGHFLSGSMGPKIVAAMRFVRATGKNALVTSLHHVTQALSDGTGTWVVPGQV